jgi:hypothetical protein
VKLSREVVDAALAKRGVKVKSHQVRESNTEPTSIIETDRPLTPDEAHELSVELQQDAIAQKVGDAGELYGPKAQEWGPFNPEYFLQPEPAAMPAKLKGRVKADTTQHSKRARKAISTIKNPERVAFPGIYKKPEEIAREAAARTAPENPAMKRLFGVTREELAEIGQHGTRKGDEAPHLPGLAKKPKGAESASRVMVPANEERLIETLRAGEKYAPEMVQGMDAWYVQDPLYQHFVRLYGPERAKQEFKDFEAYTGMASPGTDVESELKRGTAARWLDKQGRWDDWMKHGGGALNNPSAPADMRAIPGHPYHSTAQAGPMNKYRTKGLLDMKSPKVPLYIQSAGVPETGFQTAYPVGDAHWSRGVGLADARTNKRFGKSVENSEIGVLGPWWRDKIAAPVGIESVPAQARLWGLMSPQTGVNSLVGAPKLEMQAEMIMRTAKRLNISPEEARDMVILAQTHAGKADPKLLAALGLGGAGLLGGYAASRRKEKR